MRNGAVTILYYAAKIYIIHKLYGKSMLARALFAVKLVIFGINCNKQSAKLRLLF